MSNPCVDQITQAFLSNQSEGELEDICVYMGPSRQFGHGFSDFICNALRTKAPVIMRVANILFESSAESLINGN